MIVSNLFLWWLFWVCAPVSARPTLCGSSSRCSCPRRKCLFSQPSTRASLFPFPLPDAKTWCHFYTSASSGDNKDSQINLSLTCQSHTKDTSPFSFMARLLELISQSGSASWNSFGNSSSPSHSNTHPSEVSNSGSIYCEPTVWKANDCYDSKCALVF